MSIRIQVKQEKEKVYIFIIHYKINVYGEIFYIYQEYNARFKADTHKNMKKIFKNNTNSQQFIECYQPQ